MPTVEIYQAGTRIDSKKFHTEFMVTEMDENEVVWESDGDPVSEKGGGILVWFRGKDPPEIHFVPPRWKLIIDGVTVIGESNVDPRLRFNVPVRGTTIELHHGDLRFVFRLSPVDMCNAHAQE
jgi:hypothetical protein